MSKAIRSRSFWLALAYVGLILLAGIAINNALLLVHRAGVLLRRSGDRMEAARQAARERFRPIVITTATSAAGLAPLAWAADPGTAASWNSLALAAIAGLITSTVVTLVVIPAFFSLIAARPAERRSAAVVSSP